MTRILLLLTLLLLALPARAAEPRAELKVDLQPTGLALYGTPALPADFTHFPFVNAAAPKGGQLKIAVTGTFDSTHPYLIKGTPPPAPFYNVFVFEALMYRAPDEPFTIYPWLAQKVWRAPDNSAVIFRLNPAARWQDGVPVTADDVIFSWQNLRTQGRANMRSYYNRAVATKLDALTVQFDLKPLADGTYDQELPLIIGLMPILPAHDWADKDFGATTLRPLMGSGAYKITAVEPGRKITLSRNANYWAAALPIMRGQQNPEVIVLDFYRDDTVAREAVLAGAADFRFEVDALRHKKIAAENKNVVAEFVPHQRPELYKGIVLNTRRALFANAVLRQALQQAGDWAQLNQTLFGGVYQRSFSQFANSPLAAPHAKTEALLLQNTTQRRVRLKQIKTALLAAGFTYQGAVLQAPDGTPVQFEILLGDAADERLVLGFARQLRVLGIGIKVRTVDSAQFQARLNDFDYDAVVTRWVNSLSPGNEQRIYWGSASAGVKGSRNYAGVQNAAVDAAIDKLLAAPDYAALRLAAQQVDAELIAGNYVIPFFYVGADMVLRGSRVQRPETVPLTGIDMRTLWVVD